MCYYYRFIILYTASTSLQPNRQPPAAEQVQEHNEVETDDAGPHHQPIIELPKPVEVTTEEENEEVVFSRRAKLFRYVPPEWKERGVGDMKILKHKLTGKYRVVMRREQVLKLCANHHVLSGMRISPQGSSAKAWVWSAMDFSESPSEPRQETFAVKFKTVDEAKEFYIAFVEGSKAVDKKEVPSVSMPPPTSSSVAASAFLRKEALARVNNKLNADTMNQTTSQERCFGDIDAKTSEPTFKFSQPFNPNQNATATFGFGEAASIASRSNNSIHHTTTSQGFNLPSKPSRSWNCPDCYASNAAENKVCLCCNCANPNIDASQLTTSKPLSSQSFGMSSTTASSSGFSFGIPKSSDEPESSAKPYPALQKAGAPASFKFGIGNSNSTNDLIFGSANLTFGIFDSSTQSPASGEQHAKPHFLSVGNENDAYSDSTTSDETGDDDYSGESDHSEKQDEKVLVSYRSLMNRLSSQKEQETSDENKKEKGEDADDVICVGEILPSKELQEKEKELQLPPHFYNYLIPEQSSDADSTDDSKSVPRPDPPLTVAAAPGFAFGLGSSNVTFAQLAASNSTTGFSFSANLEKSDDSAWKPDTKPMFSSQLSEHANDDQDTSVDDIHVTPLIDLPKQVTVETGEENETTLFTKRAKLYRWDKETGQWKERGLGDILIKHNPSNKSFRILMRREQVLKVCANHYITPEMKMEETFGSDRAWSWVAADFSENQEQPEMEMFAIRFKTPEFALEFKDRFDECQLLLRGDTETGNCPNPSGSHAGMSTSTLINNAEKMKSELGFFKDHMSVKSNIDLENTFTEDLKTSSMSKFDSNLPLTPLVKQHQLDKEKLYKESRIPRTVREKSIPLDKPQTAPDADAPAKTSLGSSKFEFKLKADSSTTSNQDRSPRRNVSVCSVASEDSQTDQIHFEPIIPLLEKVSVPTGEENCQLLFEERAKLFIFDRDNQQWKERGIGNIHLLQDANTFKLRLVMRREQVLKVCLNHFVSSDITFSYKENSANKVLVWAATDFSDLELPNGETLQFALRFKTSDICARFMACLDEGRTAADEKKLMDPVLVQSNLSAHEDATEERDEEATSPAGSSPVKPAKPLFSFADVESPFSKTHNYHIRLTDSQFGDFKFESSETKPTPSNFNFNKTLLSFNLGFTSTPSASNFPATPPSLPTTNLLKSDVSKSLFGADPPVFTAASEKKVSESFQSISSPFSFKPNSHPTFQFNTGTSLTEPTMFPPQDTTVVAAVIQESSTVADNQEPEERTGRPETGNLFQSFSGMSDFSFATMAAATSSKHAFGSRKDAAFNVSAASKVLFQGQGDNECNDPEIFNPEYKPVLAELPPLVEVMTGEEEEEIVFKERCKLYKFDEVTSQWKERGLGELKILHHPKLNWYRVVMRREQVLKVCANHRIKKDMKLLRNSEKAWMYIAHDKAEEEDSGIAKFTARFKTPQIADHFHDVWVEAQSDMEDS